MSTDFDQNTAWIRRAQTDMKAFVEGLASRLEGDMPGFVEVERKRDGLFAKTSHIEAITIHRRWRRRMWVWLWPRARISRWKRRISPSPMAIWAG